MAAPQKRRLERRFSSHTIRGQKLPAHIALPECALGKTHASSQAQKKMQQQILEYLRHDWVKTEMRSREKEFVDYSTLRMLVATWNVNGKKPNQPIDCWLGAQIYRASLGGRAPDIVAVGLQEMVELNAQNLMLQRESLKRAALWEAVVLRTLNAQGSEKFCVVATQVLVGVWLCVAVQEKHISAVRGVSAVTTAVGIGGVLGNKGAAVVRFRLHDSTICFVCSHLAAHRKNVEGRNAHFHTILGRTQLEFDDRDTLDPAADATAATPSPMSDRLKRQGSARSSPKSAKKRIGGDVREGFGGSGLLDEGHDHSSTDPAAVWARQAAAIVQRAGDDDDERGVANILDHDFVFWLGDLNYRIDVSVDIEDVFELVEQRDWKALEAKDQLKITQRQGHAFKGWHEGALRFPPTYKYQTGTHKYEQRPEKKHRAPAWCDRVLWRCAGHAQDDHCKLLKYVAVRELNMSDHKPVVSTLAIRLRDVVPRRRQRVTQAVTAQFARWILPETPRVEVFAVAPDGKRSRVVDFGLVRYHTTVSRTMTIRNPGPGVAHFRFLPRLHGPICKSWLSVQPKAFGTLPPGKSVQLELRMCIEGEAAKGLVSGRTKLDDVLQIRVELGEDVVVAVKGQFMPSCMGMSIGQLCNTRVPVVDLYTSSEAELKAAAGETAQVVPKELFRLCDHLFHHAGGRLYRNESNLFQEEGDFADMQRIRAALDTNAPFPREASAHSFTGVLLELISCFETPVVPRDLCPGPDFDPLRAAEWTSDFMSLLSAAHYNLLVYVVSFLRELLRHRKENGLTPQVLAKVFTNAMLQCETSWSDAWDPSLAATQEKNFASVFVFLLTSANTSFSSS